MRNTDLERLRKMYGDWSTITNVAIDSTSHGRLTDNLPHVMRTTDCDFVWIVSIPSISLPAFDIVVGIYESLQDGTIGDKLY